MEYFEDYIDEDGTLHVDARKPRPMKFKETNLRVEIPKIVRTVTPEEIAAAPKMVLHHVDMLKIPTKEDFKRWFITTPPDGRGDDIQQFPDNDGNTRYLCACPDGFVSLSRTELNEMFEARKIAWQKVVKE